ncbi:MAG: hypothetical protein OEX83_01935 [Gammaproteobacteria bacterium]|nr:hypothetical protein [Gammaproteobacteria bacterium]
MLYQKDLSRSGTSKQQWLEKLGLAGFLFFFIKGMLWILLPVLLVALGIE